MSTKFNAGSILHVDEVRKKIEQLPVGEQRTKLEIRFSQTVQTLAAKIAAAARRK
ncbi:MAG TPA: hypothetical protein VFE60_28330 [Roseiarcus sp.]|nr:hypothetical protein [Roseiarcus sp.]